MGAEMPVSWLVYLGGVKGWHPDFLARVTGVWAGLGPAEVGQGRVPGEG